MPKILYVSKKFDESTFAIIDKANEILEDYDRQGFVLTLRQLYYQFVARDILPNKVESYKRLGSIVGDARLSGLIDWDFLEDRTRNLAKLQHFDGPQDALDKLAGWYHIDMWANQKYRPEVWIEKDALVGVIEPVCQENDIPFFSCRGYTSLSEMWRAAMRLRRWMNTEQIPYIIHFGDHDPSGIDMSRDICDRIRDTFMSDCEFKRVALNMDQIEEYSPPPNPAKVSDPRAKAYIQEFGDDSWELDALEPSKFRELIETSIAAVREDSQWEKDEAERRRVKTRLEKLAKEWNKSSNGKKKK